MAKKLFISDLDGTLYWDGRQYSSQAAPASLAAIRRWRDAGNLFAVATARIHLFHAPLTAELGFSVDYLGSNGADLIFSDGERECYPTSVGDFLTVASWIRERRLDGTAKIYTGGRWVNSARGLYPYTEPARMRNAQREGRTLSEVSLSPADTGLNMSLILRPEFLKEAQAGLKKLLKGRLDPVASDYDNLDFIPEGCSKGLAVRCLAAHYGLSREDVIVIGDSENDVSMFEAAGRSFAMAHAPKEVRQKADETAASVAEAIERCMGRGCFHCMLQDKRQNEHRLI